MDVEACCRWVLLSTNLSEKIVETYIFPYLVADLEKKKHAMDGHVRVLADSTGLPGDLLDAEVLSFIPSYEAAEWKARASPFRLTGSCFLDGAPIARHTDIDVGVASDGVIVNLHTQDLEELNKQQKTFWIVYAAGACEKAEIKIGDINRIHHISPSGAFGFVELKSTNTCMKLVCVNKRSGTWEPAFPEHTFYVTENDEVYWSPSSRYLVARALHNEHNGSTFFALLDVESGDMQEIIPMTKTPEYAISWNANETMMQCELTRTDVFVWNIQHSACMKIPLPAKKEEIYSVSLFLFGDDQLMVIYNFEPDDRKGVFFLRVQGHPLDFVSQWSIHADTDSLQATLSSHDDVVFVWLEGPLASLTVRRSRGSKLETAVHTAQVPQKNQHVFAFSTSDGNLWRPPAHFGGVCSWCIAAQLAGVDTFLPLNAEDGKYAKTVGPEPDLLIKNSMEGRLQGQYWIEDYKLEFCGRSIYTDPICTVYIPKSHPGHPLTPECFWNCDQSVLCVVIPFSKRAQIFFFSNK